MTLQYSKCGRLSDWIENTGGLARKQVAQRATIAHLRAIVYFK